MSPVLCDQFGPVEHANRTAVCQQAPTRTRRSLGRSKGTQNFGHAMNPYELLHLQDTDFELRIILTLRFSIFMLHAVRVPPKLLKNPFKALGTACISIGLSQISPNPFIPMYNCHSISPCRRRCRGKWIAVVERERTLNNLSLRHEGVGASHTSAVAWGRHFDWFRGRFSAQ
jgi:hypothetical protein